MLNLVGEVEGRDCVILDDLTSTAGTLCGAAKMLKGCGANSVIAAVTHSLLTEAGANNILNSEIDELICTDSVPIPANLPEIPLTVLSVSELLGDAILRIHNNQSVSSLFRI
jgi:ribose-phosphate pyrophosphokinase